MSCYGSVVDRHTSFVLHLTVVLLMMPNSFSPPLHPPKVIIQSARSRSQAPEPTTQYLKAEHSKHSHRPPSLPIPTFPTHTHTHTHSPHCHHCHHHCCRTHPPNSNYCGARLPTRHRGALRDSPQSLRNSPKIFALSALSDYYSPCVLRDSGFCLTLGSA